MRKAAIHVHSTYSDGEFSLSDLKRVFAATGFAFVCVTDHAEDFDDQRLRDYAGECQSLSSEHFCMVPGLEYECESRMHILSIGATSLTDTKDPESVIRHIRSHGGISVVAHPKEAAFQSIEKFQELPNGIEVWNSKYDGRYAPRPQTFALLRRLRERNLDIHGFFGQDLHWRKQYRGLMTLVRCNQFTPQALVVALKSGEYSGVKGSLELPSSGELPAALLERFGVVNRRSHLLKSWLIEAKGRLDRLGVGVPVSVKAPLRRFF